MNEVSVIIPVKGKVNLTALLESIDQNICEILIIGKTIENFNLAGLNVKLIDTDENRSVARNIGAELAQHQYLLFLDADMEMW